MDGASRLEEQLEAWQDRWDGDVRGEKVTYADLMAERQGLGGHVVLL